MKFAKRHKMAAKLSGEQVLRIRELYEAGYSQGHLARTFLVTIGTIGRIVRGESWQGVAGHGETGGPAPALNLAKAQGPELEANQSAERLAKELRELGLGAQCPHGQPTDQCPECSETMGKFGLG
jgi:hypothetical protein